MIVNILLKHVELGSGIVLYEASNRLVVFFSCLLITSYILSAPNHAHLRFLATSNDESKLLCGTLLRIVIASFSAMVIVSIVASCQNNGAGHLIFYEYFFSALVVLYYFAEMLKAHNLIDKILFVNKFREYSMAAKLVSFLNEKFPFLAIVGMIATISFNYVSSTKVEVIFFKNVSDVCALLVAMFVLQAAVAAVINKFVKKLECLEKSESTASSKRKNLVWICDVIVLAIYFSVVCFALKCVGLDVHQHILHNKSVTIALVVFINIIINRGFNEFANAIIEKEEKDDGSDGYKVKLLTFIPTISVIFNALLFGTSGLVILANLGINISPILATLAVFSASIGLAAKDVIQSFLQGIMLLIEKNFYVGECVMIDGVVGVIEKLSVRVIHLRGADGSLTVIPYHMINVIVNYSRDYACCNDELIVGAKENVNKVTQILVRVINEMKKDPNYAGKILSDVMIYGLKPFDLAGLKIYWNVQTIPGISGILLKYEIYRRLGEEFQKQGIEIPMASAVKI
jgi:small-conductance mechanosensitive channel